MPKNISKPRLHCPNLLPAVVPFSIMAALGLLLVAVTGCQTESATGSPAASGQASPTSEQERAKAELDKMSTSAWRAPSEPMLLREGDSLKISFPGAPSLNTTVIIRPDGKIALPLVGEVQAAGTKPAELEKTLVDKYGPQLQVKEVSVSVESAAFPIYVAGAVLRPGKVISNRPLTVLEAIMEAGGFDNTKANLKAVKIIRNENGRTQHYKLDLKPLLKGEATHQFTLKPSDIIYVPERFYWF